MLKEEDNVIGELGGGINLIEKKPKPGNLEMTDSSFCESDFYDDEESFKMLTKTAGTLAFAAPERIADNCFYTYV